MSDKILYTGGPNPFNEEWRDVVGFEGLYQISSMGRVKSLERLVVRKDDRRVTFKEKIKAIDTDRNGYLRAALYRGNKSQNKFVHRMVADAFIPNPDNLTDINHIDGNTGNNEVSNLERCTHKHNMDHANRTGLLDPNKRKVLAVSHDGYAYKLNSMVEGAEELTKITGINFDKQNISVATRTGKPYHRYMFYYGHDAPVGYEFAERRLLCNGGKDDGKECTITMCYQDDIHDYKKCLGWCKPVLRIVKTEVKEETVDFSKFEGKTLFRSKVSQPEPEESQKELWEEVLKYCEEHYINDIRVREHMENHFVIQRKK